MVARVLRFVLVGLRVPLDLGSSLGFSGVL